MVALVAASFRMRLASSSGEPPLISKVCDAKRPNLQAWEQVPHLSSPTIQSSTAGSGTRARSLKVRVQGQLPSISESIIGRALSILAVGNPEWCRGFNTLIYGPPMVANVYSGIRRRCYNKGGLLGQKCEGPQ